MTDEGTSGPGRPWHLWLIGIIGCLWSSIGVLSFLLTQLNVEAAMSKYSPKIREYYENFPLWAEAFWAIGVFGGVFGCLLMLLGKRLACPVLVASLLGAIVSNFSGLFFLGGMEAMEGTGALGIAIFIILFAAFLAWYARAMSAKGVLG